MVLVHGLQGTGLPASFRGVWCKVYRGQGIVFGYWVSQLWASGLQLAEETFDLFRFGTAPVQLRV